MPDEGSQLNDEAWCISRSCTTGWLDWVHGQLWLLPTGLLRRRMSLAETRANGYDPTVAVPPPRAPVVDFDLTRIAAEHRTNKVIPFEAVARARLVRGLTTDALRLTLRDTTPHRLLWLTRDPAYDILMRVLPALLGDRFAR
jgi:hypothetical protein